MVGPLNPNQGLSKIPKIEEITKGQFGASFFKTLWRDSQDRPHIGMTSIRFAWMEPFGNTRDIPIFERFYLGGARTVRGFRTFHLGPHEGQDFVGGTGMVYGKAEYKFPLVDRVLRGVFFVDWGILEDDLESVSTNRVRISPGGGVELTLPLPIFGTIPIGLYWANAVRSEDEDRERLFNFSFGSGIVAPF